MTSRISKSGFTLVELITVLTLLGIALAVLAPALMNWQERRALTDAAQNIKTALEGAHMQAIAQGHVYGVYFHAPAAGEDYFVLLGLYELDLAADNVYGKRHKLLKTVRFQLPLPAANIASLEADTGLAPPGGLIAFRASGEVEPRYLEDPSQNPVLTLRDSRERTKTLTVDRISGQVTLS